MSLNVINTKQNAIWYTRNLRTSCQDYKCTKKNRNKLIHGTTDKDEWRPALSLYNIFKNHIFNKYLWNNIIISFNSISRSEWKIPFGDMAQNSNTLSVLSKTCNSINSPHYIADGGYYFYPSVCVESTAVKCSHPVMMQELQAYYSVFMNCR